MRFFQSFFVLLVVLSISYILYSWYRNNTYEYKLSEVISNITDFQNQYLEHNSPVWFEVERLKEQLFYTLQYNSSFKELPIFNSFLEELSVELLNNAKEIHFKKIRDSYPSLRIGLVYNCKKKNKDDVCSYESRILNNPEMSSEEKRFLLKKAGEELNQQVIDYLSKKNEKEIQELKQILKEIGEKK